MFPPALRRSVLGIALGLFAVLAVPASADDKEEKKVEVNVGDDAPTFQLRDDRDKTWSSSDSFGKKWVVTH